MGAVEAPIRDTERWFIGEDRTIRFDVTDSSAAAQTMTGWELTWELLDRVGGSALISKTTGSGITIGNGNGTDDRATVAVSDTDTEGLPGVNGMQTGAAATYWHVLRRTDAGVEAVIAFGAAVLHKGSV